ncbi:hypothetical protein V8C86DRAFT_3033815, partial [Haematococcus lacustris]
MVDALGKQVEAAFAKLRFHVSEPDVLAVCVQLVKEFGITPEDLARDYDITSNLRDSHSAEITMASIKAADFRKTLNSQAKAAKAHVQASVKLSSAVKMPFSASWENMSEREQYQTTPKRPAPRPATTPGQARPAAPPAGSASPEPDAHAWLASPPPSKGPQGQGAAQPPPLASTPGTQGRQVHVVSCLNEQVDVSSIKPPAQRCGVQLVGEALPHVGAHLFMMETLETKVQAVEERLQSWLGALGEALGPGVAAEAGRQSLAQVTQEAVWVVGRVVSDTAVEGGGGAGGALSAAGVMLEGSREVSGGARVRLDTAPLAAQGGPQGVRLFPGQVVAVRGVNPLGHTFIAQQLLSHLPPPPYHPPPASESAAAGGPQGGPGGGPAAAGCVVVVAAGPFNAGPEGGGWAPLQLLLEQCSALEPDVVLLLGPFLDVQQPGVATASLTRTFEEEVQLEVTSRLAAWSAAHPASCLLLLPSTRDAHHVPVLPTPAFDMQSAGGAGAGPGVLTSFQSPATLALSPGSQAGAGTAPPLVLGACSADVLKALSACELARGGPPRQDRMAALAAHVVGQRSYFPLYPPPLGTCLDLGAASALELLALPHLLVLPSDLAPFAKLVTSPPLPQPQPQGDGAAGAAGEASTAMARGPEGRDPVICINPGRVVKGSSAGSYAVVRVAAGSAALHSRCKVEAWLAE